MKFNSYPNYKDSKIEWIGEIPTNWEVKRIADIYQYRNEKVSDKDFRALSVTKKGIVPQLETAAKTIHGDDRKRVEVNDFVINSRSDRRGSCGVSKYRGSVSLICHVLETIDKEFYADYGHFLFRNEMFSQEFYRWGRGIVDDLWSTRWSEMKKIMLPYPPLKEQIEIADLLNKETSKVDLTIEKYEKLIEILKEKRIALISYMVTKGLNKDVEMKDSGVEWIGEIPVHWKISKVKYNTYVKGRIGWQALTTDEYVNKGPYLVTGTDFKDGKIDWNTCHHVSEERYELDTKIQLKENDLLITKDGSIGKVALVKDLSYKTTLNSGIFVTRPIKDYITDYMYWLLLSNCFKGYVDYMKTGSTVLHLYQETFENFAFQLPPINEQKKIANYLKTRNLMLESLIKKIQKQITLLKEYKISLISHAVTGKIDLRITIPK